MAFLRFSRDKRGYEHYYLVESTTNRRGKTRARVLYWFRTPPNVKVGREPFDEQARRTLESENPGVAFDWRKISETPIPSPETDRWRERRRLERAERAARRSPEPPSEEAESPIAEAVEENLPEAGEELPAEADGIDAAIDAAERQADALDPTEESIVAESASIGDTPVAAAPAEAPQVRKRRRRHRGRRGRHQGAAAPTADGAATASEPGEPPKPDTPSGD